MMHASVQASDVLPLGAANTEMTLGEGERSALRHAPPLPLPVSRPSLPAALPLRGALPHAVLCAQPETEGPFPAEWAASLSPFVARLLSLPASPPPSLVAGPGGGVERARAATPPPLCASASRKAPKLQHQAAERLKRPVAGDSIEELCARTWAQYDCVWP